MSKRLTMTLSNPLEGFSDTPVTTALTILLSSYCLWIGAILLRVTTNLPPARLAGYSGPASIMTIRHWGIVFIAAGIVGLLRLFVWEDRKISTILHMIQLSVLVAWAIAFDLGPAGTGQPCYTILAILSFASVFMVSTIEHRYGMRPPLHGSFATPRQSK